MAALAPQSHSASFVKVLVLPAFTFFLVPLLAVGFCWYGERKLDGMILESIQASLDRDASLEPEDRAERKAFFAAHPASAVCGDDDPDLARYREAVCERGGETWQFRAARLLGWGSLGLGLLALLAIGVLGAVAYARPAAQYWTFVLGWRLLTVVTAVVTVVQGGLLVWLSYWGTALFFNRYYPKLILIAGAFALLAVVAIVRALFRAAPGPEPLEAEQVRPEDAPGLWSRVRELAARLGTAPPRVIAAGIDDNFFVTESPLPLGDGTPGGGRLLYVSLPLLRTLSTSEADAVLGHELAHFKGGDTAASARLAPALVRYETAWATLAQGGLTLPASHVLRLYRALFELALSRERRRRELQADAEAARLTSPDDLARSLLKVAGYSDFRARTEQALFEQREVHRGTLGLQERIDAGLAAHAASPAFLDHVTALEVPHPFDSHPPLQERLASVKASVGVADAGALLQARPADSWADAVLTAAAIEGRLWAAYEARFKEGHEVSLAWRSLPSTDEERALVVKHFPDAAFPLKDGGQVLVTHLALTTAEGTVVRFSEVQEAKVDSGTFSNALVLKVAQPGAKARTVKVKLGPLGKQQDRFKAVFAQYWQRDQVARKAVAGE